MRILLVLVVCFALAAMIIAAKWFIWDKTWGYGPEFTWINGNTVFKLDNPDMYYALTKCDCSADNGLSVEFNTPNARSWRLISLAQDYSYISELNSNNVQVEKDKKITIKVLQGKTDNNQLKLNCSEDGSHIWLLYSILLINPDNENQLIEQIPVINE